MNTGRYITVQVAGRQCLVDRNKLVSTFNVLLLILMFVKAYCHIFMFSLLLFTFGLAFSQGNKYECSMYHQSCFKQKKKKIFK